MNTPWIRVIVILTFVAVLLVGYFMPMLQSAITSVSAATDYLEDRGYVVFSAAEFTLVAKEATAYAAVQNANAAVVAAENAVEAAELAVEKVDLFNSAEVFLFPSVTSVTITLTAGATNVWSAWAEVADSLAVTLSSKFVTYSGYINDMYIYDHSAVDKIYCIELAYGDDKITLGRMMWHTSFKDTVQIKSRRVPAGETIYYRMMCSGANGATAKIGFRYFFE